MEHTNANAPKTPTNILIKKSTLKKLNFLTIEERGILFTNIFHFHSGDDLLEMTPITEMVYIDLAEVFEYNSNKYEKVVERNRENGKKNLGKNKKGPVTQNNPLGITDNPEEAKDKTIEKAVVKEKAPLKEKGIEKVINKENEIDVYKENPVDIQLNRSRFDIDTKSYNSIEKIKAIVQLDISPIFDYESSRFIKNCKTLVNSSGWEGFYKIILNSEAKEVPALFELYKPELSKETILDMRTNLVFYLSKFDKILNYE